MLKGSVAVVERSASPDHAELAGLLEAEVPSRELGEVLDSLLGTAIRRVSRDPEAPLDHSIRAHARARKQEGKDVSQVLEEYSGLRDALMNVWERDAPGSFSLLRALNEAIDEAIVATVQEYRVGGELLSMICHDIRNPLQSLLLCGTQLQRTQNKDPGIERTAEVIMRAISRMNRLLDDLALFASTDLTAREATPVEVDPRAFVEEVLEAHRGAAQDKKLRLRTRADMPRQPVTIDRNRVLRVLHHLILHAIKVSPHGGEITLGVRGGERATWFVLEHGGHAPRSLDLAIARALAGGIGGELRLEHEGSSIVFSTSA